MLTAITYNCDPDSLGEVAQAEFAESFENEVRVKPVYRDLSIRVTFDAALASGVTEFASDDWEADISDDYQLQAWFAECGRRAFNHCLAAAE